MLDYTGEYGGYSDYERQRKARAMLDKNEAVLHVVIGYKDSDGIDIPVFLIFDDQDEWDAWVDLYQYLGGYIDALHTQGPIY